MKTLLATIAAFPIFTALAPAAEAHTGHVSPGSPAASFAAGFAHPFSGADHLVAALAMGFWARQLSRPARRAVPGAFLGAMAAGGVVATATGAMVIAEPAILASVLGAGVLIAIAAEVPTAAAAAVAGAFAFFHGHAHVAELPGGTSAAAYGTGFIVATAMILAAGSGVAALAAARGWRRQIVARVCGGVVAATALILYLI